MNQKKELIQFLSSFISENRRSKFDTIINNRTRFITVVLEDIYQSHNASAVLRTCDCFGVQDIHIIENRNKYTINPDVVMGASDWLTLHKYNETESNTSNCLKGLKKRGYKIAATSLHEQSIDIHQLNANEKTALIFGTEISGISEAVKEEADIFVKIPMYGFTESFNISVSAALCIHVLSEKMRNSTINWHLSEEEKEILMLSWIKKNLHSPELLEEEFYKRNRA